MSIQAMFRARLASIRRALLIYRKLVSERFETFHQNHPEIYRQFKYVAYEILAATLERREKYSAMFLFDVMRYHAILANKPFPRVQAGYTTRYAGLLVQEDEKFQTFFVSYVEG